MGMKKMIKNNLMMTGTVSAVLLLFACVISFGQGAPAELKPLTIQCSAQGTSTQSDKLTSITVRINEYSTEQERQTLVGVFKESGSPGLTKALKKMPSKGVISITGKSGYDVRFIRVMPDSPAGTRKLRIVTDRPIAVIEQMSASANVRTLPHSITALEITLVMSDVEKKSTGILLPACQLVVDKKTKEVTIESYQNPWKLFNFFGYKEGK
jgi:hypothetical protein